MEEKKHPNYILLSSIAILMLSGVLILTSVSAPYSQQKFGNTYYFLRHQLLFGILPGLILGFIAYKISLNLVKKYALLLLLGNLLLLGMVFLPVIGSGFNGAHSWINLGFSSFQPSESLKLFFIIYLAAWLSNKENNINKSKSKSGKEFSQTFLAFLIIIAVITVLLALQPDIGTLGIIIACAVVVYFCANTPLWQSILMGIISAGGFYGLIRVSSYRLSRLQTFLNPDLNTESTGYQISHALITTGSGGIKGLGLGANVQKMGFLPEPISDSIFAVFGLETGFLGCFFLISIFFIFLWCGLKIAKESTDKFYQLLAIGIVCWIILQAFVNIGAIIGIVPLTGIPLPFISYGGSAIIFELIAVGLLLNISKKHD